MKRILFIATVPNFLTGFLKNNFKILHDLGWEIHVATNTNVESKRPFPEYIIVHHIPVERSPVSIKNADAYRELIKIINSNNIDVIDCHTPVGGVLGRLVAHKMHKKCIYTAHGFHFYKGAPLKNWVIFYPIEKWMSRYTNFLITINNEDYNRAKKFYCKKIYKIPGVGIDIKRFQLKDFDRNKYRENLGLGKDDFVILSVGELNKNKNHETIIKAISLLNNKNVHYIIAGEGILKEYLMELAKKLNLENQIKLLGYRTDIPELNYSSDVFAFPSKREGLGLSAIEAMASGLPILGSNIHGINDYLINGETGFSCPPNDIEGFKKGLQKLIDNKKLINKIKYFNKHKSNIYDQENTKKILKKIYENIEEEIYV